MGTKYPEDKGNSNNEYRFRYSQVYLPDLYASNSNANIILNNFSTTSELSITIPVLESTCCNLPPPELAIVRTADQFTIDAAMQESGCVIQDDIERNSTYETASVASDLTRMCVSDEEDKLEFIQESEDENSL